MDLVEEKRKQREFALVLVSEVSSSSSSASPGVAVFAGDSLQIRNKYNRILLSAHLTDVQPFRLGPIESVCMVEGSDADKQTSYSSGVAIQFRNEEESEAFHCVFQQWKKEFNVQGTYYAAVIENRSDFMGRVVVDVGAGSGILSLFAAQAGAKHVYAVEASEMAEYARKLIAGNPILGQRITVIKGKVEDVELPERADILISEPMGTLLVNERMLESYVIARDRFLTPNGKMFPSVGRIHMAPFSDEYLFVEIANKALFWQQQNYYGVDLTPLHGTAFQGYFSQVQSSFSLEFLLTYAFLIWGSCLSLFMIPHAKQKSPVVDAFDPRLLIGAPMFHVIDFTKIKEEELYEIDIPLRFIATVGARLHGLACWFDVLFNGSTARRWLTTAPGSPTTHWYQLRCVLSQPIYVVAGQEITGRMHLIAHTAQSYTIYLTLSAKTWGPGAEQGGILQTSSCKLDLKEPYYRMSQPQAYPLNQDQQPQVLLPTQDINIQSQDLDEVEMMQQPSPKSCAQIDSLMQNA
ncbi:hypothetical protein V8G54_005287 [Vigna mungo]|uniref:type I protein arginine methyltransferase n=1 Tax=Vigna mungo TaxID=3915 RepID=A0AAQ3NYX9_VIGMU